MNNRPRFHFKFYPEQSSRLATADVAMHLGLSNKELRQIVQAGHLTESAGGGIELAELKRYQRELATLAEESE